MTAPLRPVRVRPAPVIILSSKIKMMTENDDRQKKRVKNDDVMTK